ncbi:MAG: pilus assembly protein [Alphaproteobacteria bacterium]|nr:pilus assembly protein [Alphaproteobacteria bacterium]
MRRLGRDVRGNIAILFAILLVPLAIAIGAGVDYGHAVQIRTSLQNTVDSAALSGASAYISPSAESTAQTLAQSYVTKGLAALPSNVTVNSTTVTPGTQGSGNNTAYTMHVSATVTMPTTFTSFYQKSITITVSATATNPVVTATFDTGSFVSYACDLNQIYWYVVPADGGVPDASAMNLLWSNNDANPPSQVSFNVAASAKIGFAMENTTGGRDPNLGGCNYGNTMYGAQPGDTQWLYSSMQPPSKYYNIAPGGTNTGTHATYETDQDCALVVEQGTYNKGKGTWTYPPAPQNKCFSTSGHSEDAYNQGHNTFCYNCRSGPKMSAEMTNAAPSCSQLNGVSYQYDWNDMGANVDNLNYGNDMQYSFSCSGGAGSGNGTSTTSVTLTN